MKQKKDKKNMTFKEKVIENINVFLSAYVIAFVIRLLLIEAYQIPSQSMVPSLLVKDILMVEKGTMGSRIPILNWKIPGLLRPERNDVVVFVSPAWKSPGIAQELISLFTLSLINLDNTFDMPKNLVKRLVGKPGDVISMSNQNLYINHQIVQTDFVMISHQAIYNMMRRENDRDFNLFSEKFDGRERIIQHIYGFDREVGGDYKEAMIKMKADDVVNNFDMYRFYLFSHFPDIRIPKKGDVINLIEADGYYKYLIKLLIERETGKTVTFSNSKFYLDGKEINEWKINDNYYFCMGDNRDYSEDCRYFGFIPEKNIFGRPLFRYWPFTRLGFNVNENSATVKYHRFDD